MHIDYGISFAVAEISADSAGAGQPDPHLISSLSSTICCSEDACVPRLQDVARSKEEIDEKILCEDCPKEVRVIHGVVEICQTSHSMLEFIFLAIYFCLANAVTNASCLWQVCTHHEVHQAAHVVARQ